jgi:hypothetical protein
VLKRESTRTQPQLRFPPRTASKCTMSWHLQFTRCTHGRRRASAWVSSSMSPLLSADDWSLHVCDQQVRGSSSCHFKCTMSWHLQFTRCTFARRRASAWVGSSMESTIDCGRLATTRVRPASPRQQQPAPPHSRLEKNDIQTFVVTRFCASTLPAKRCL